MNLDEFLEKAKGWLEQGKDIAELIKGIMDLANTIVPGGLIPKALLSMVVNWFVSRGIAVEELRNTLDEIMEDIENTPDVPEILEKDSEITPFRRR